jgi:hypothetical protein
VVVVRPVSRGIDSRRNARAAMIAFEWNGLEVDDHLLVHDAASVDGDLRDAVVVSVDLFRRPHGVGVRVLDGDVPIGATIWPTRMQVHVGALNASESCWRCDVDAAVPRA